MKPAFSNTGWQSYKAQEAGLSQGPLSSAWQLVTTPSPSPPPPPRPMSRAGLREQPGAHSPLDPQRRRPGGPNPAADSLATSFQSPLEAFLLRTDSPAPPKQKAWGYLPATRRARLVFPRDPRSPTPSPQAGRACMDACPSAPRHPGAPRPQPHVAGQGLAPDLPRCHAAFAPQDPGSQTPGSSPPGAVETPRVRRTNSFKLGRNLRRRR